MRKLKMAALLGFAGLLTSVGMVSAEETIATQETVKEVKCYVRITGTNEWMSRTQLVVSEDAAKVVYGEGTEGVTAIDALVEGCYYAFYKEDPTLEDLEAKKGLVKLLMGATTVSEGWVDGVMGDYYVDNINWMFADGKTSPSIGVVDYQVTEKSDLWFYYADWMYGYRGYFDNTEYTAKEGEAVNVALSAVPVMNEMFGTYEMVPVSGTITAEGNGKIYTFNCDAQGKATITNLPAGVYTLSAAWTDEEVGYVLTSPVAKLIVEAIEETTTEAPTTKANIAKAQIKSVKNVKSKKAKVNIKKISGVTGYQIKYSTSKKFTSAKKIRTSKTTYTIKKLKKGKKYYVKVRAYKTVNNTRYYGKWSKVKKVKIKK